MEFRDLKRQYDYLREHIDAAVADILDSACFISGVPVQDIEQKLAEYVDVKHCISCGNGTDAITISLMAYGIGYERKTDDFDRKEAVFVPDFTFFSTGECAALCGAVPVFVDVRQDTYNMDPLSLENTIQRILSEGVLIPRAVIAVDLFGLPADYDAIDEICDEYGLILLEDGAQGFGGQYKGKRACSFGNTATTSFFPAKPLGCYGDGGAIFTNDDDIAMRCRSIAVHGKDMSNQNDPCSKYNNVRLGMNSRLDTLQAAILIEKLKAFKEYELNDINKVAGWYSERLSDVEGLTLPVVPEGLYSSWAQYTVQLPEGVDRTRVQSRMKEAGIPTMIYYIKPMHKQSAFEDKISAIADCPVTEYLCDHVLCLPIHPYMTEDQVDSVASNLKCFLTQ